MVLRRSCDVEEETEEMWCGGKGKDVSSVGAPTSVRSQHIKLQTGRSHEFNHVR